MLDSEIKKIAKEQGARVVKLRELTHLSARAFASKYNISAGTYRNWEMGRYKGLTQKAIRQLMIAYQQEGIEVSTEWLFDGRGEEPKRVNRLLSDKETSNMLKLDYLSLTELNAKRRKINTELYVASAEGRYDDVVKALSKNANLHLVSGIQLHLYDDHENNPLHLAAQTGRLDIVKLLIENGADSNVRNRRKQTPLHLAVYNGHKDIINYLIKKGADIEAFEDEGDTPLAWAAYIGRLNIVKYLASLEANIQPHDLENNTPLHWACYKGYTEIVKFLADKKTDLNEKNRYGDTPLDCAIQNGHIETVTFLLTLQKAEN